MGGNALGESELTYRRIHTLGNFFGVAESGYEWRILISAGRALPCPYKIHVFIQQRLFLPARLDTAIKKSI
jgi:hypothetical protein